MISVSYDISTVVIKEYEDNIIKSIHFLDKMDKKNILYCGCMSNENTYRYFSSDKKAIAGFKMLAIKRYAKLTDITKKEDNHWSRIRWT